MKTIEETFSFLEKINKDYAGFNSKPTRISVIDTGSPNINNMIGIGGFPRGRISQVYGPFGSGKSFLSMIAMKNALEEDTDVFGVWIDAERSFSYDWAKKMGIWSDDKKNRLLVIKKSDGIDVFEAIYGRIKKEKFGSKKVANGILDEVIAGNLKCPIIVIDSVASIIAPREKNAPVGGLTVSALAGFLTSEIRRISDSLEEAKTALILINQVRQNLEEDFSGEKFHFPGGENLKHQISLNLYLEKISRADSLVLAEEGDKNTILGQQVKVTLKKNRFGPFPKNCTTTFLFAENEEYPTIGIINYELEIVSLCVAYKIINKGGPWYSLPNGEKFQGDKKVSEYLKENPDVLEYLKNEIRKTKGVSLSNNGEVIVEEKLNNND